MPEIRILTMLRDKDVVVVRAAGSGSRTIDRGSELTVDDAVRDLSDTNTAIYSFGFSTGKSEAAHYAYRELPGSHRYSNPPNGCMGKDPVPDPDAAHSKTVPAYVHEPLPLSGIGHRHGQFCQISD